MLSFLLTVYDDLVNPIPVGREAYTVTTNVAEPVSAGWPPSSAVIVAVYIPLSKLLAVRAPELEPMSKSDPVM